MAMAAKHRNPGAGRKPLDESEISGELERKQVRLDRESIEILTRIGRGELSLGIREAARRTRRRRDLAAYRRAGDDAE
jgi:hypothetical protein